MQVHVDPLGGWSGDMFVAACLDAFPHLWPDVQAAVDGLGLGPQSECSLVPHHDGVLTGHRFAVAAEANAPAPHHSRAHGSPGHEHTPHHETHDHHHHDHAPHRHWADIRRQLEAAPLKPAVVDHAVGIFALLAEAEAAVHGISEADVSFHEVGAVDSIVDIASAAVLIAGIGASRWTAAPLPLGGGRVQTAHGLLPVPAPATALLLRGLTTIDDGITGERVTPTGAAIARYLLQDTEATGRPAPRTLVASGTGFGSRTLPGVSNCLRVLAFDEAAVRPAGGGSFGHRELGVIEFEVDDQSSEDLTHGLDHLRARPGVHDVIQSVAFGKKGRMATHVQVLVDPKQLDDTIAACFVETTTIGLRHHIVHGAALTRRFETVEIEGRTIHVKAVTRPGGQVTGKSEAADVATHAGHDARARLRHAGSRAG